jgi:hypothetical protein
MNDKQKKIDPGRANAAVARLIIGTAGTWILALTAGVSWAWLWLGMCALNEFIAIGLVLTEEARRFNAHQQRGRTASR